MDLKIQGMPFHLKTLLDTRSDLNILNKEIILVNFSQKTQTRLDLEIFQQKSLFKFLKLHSASNNIA